MELSSNFSEQIAFNTTPKIGEHIIVVMDICFLEENLSQPLVTIKKTI